MGAARDSAETPRHAQQPQGAGGALAGALVGAGPLTRAGGAGVGTAGAGGAFAGAAGVGAAGLLRAAEAERAHAKAALSRKMLQATKLRLWERIAQINNTADGRQAISLSEEPLPMPLQRAQLLALDHEDGAPQPEGEVGGQLLALMEKAEPGAG
eukprot:6255158-Prymnesium_polylepis.1